MAFIEPFVITQEDTNVTQSDGTAESLQDLFSYRVPTGLVIVLRPGDPFKIHIDETDSSVGQNTSLVYVIIKDATGEEIKPLLGPMQYANFSASGVGEFQDEDKIVRLGIGREIRVREQEYIVVQVKNATPYADKDLSWFSLECHRER